MLPRVPLEACIQQWAAAEDVEYYSASVGAKTRASKTSRFSSFPPGSSCSCAGKPSLARGVCEHPVPASVGVVHAGLMRQNVEKSARLWAPRRARPRRCASSASLSGSSCSCAGQH